MCHEEVVLLLTARYLWDPSGKRFSGHIHLGSWGEIKYKYKDFGVTDIEIVDAISESDV